MTEDYDTNLHQCLLDISFSSSLLVTKIADLPQKSKYETIFKPLLEYCFGTSDDNILWEEHFSILHDDGSTTREYPNIDWIRDRTFIYENIFDLSMTMINHVAIKFGLWKNRSFVLTSIDYSFLTLQFLTSYYKTETDNIVTNFLNDREIVMAALKRNPLQLKFVSEELINDEEIVKIALQEGGQSFKYCPLKFQDNKEIVKIAVESYGLAFSHLSGELMNDEDIVKIAAKQNGMVLEYVNENLRNNKEIVLLAIKSNARAFRFASSQLKNDREVHFKAFAPENLLENIDNLNFASALFKNDREFLLMISNWSGCSALQYASDELKNDREVVVQCILQNPAAYRYASSELRNDREITKIAVTRIGTLLQYASEELKDDEEIAGLAISRNVLAQKFISNRLKKDTEFLLGNREYVLHHLPDKFKNERKIVLESIKFNTKVLKERVSEEMKSDREFILQVVKNSGRALEYVSEEFKKDREIVLAAVGQNGDAIYDADEEFLYDREIILKAAETCTQFKYYTKIPKDLKNDRDLTLQLVKCSSKFCSYLPIKYFRDREIALESSKTVLKCYETGVYTSLSFRLKLDRLLAIRAVKIDGKDFLNMPFIHRNDREIVTLAINQNKNALKSASFELRNDTKMLDFVNSLH